MSLLWGALRLILGVNISASTTQVAGREWLGAVFQEPSTILTRRNFSNTTQRQFSADPIGPKPLWLSPPYW